MATKIKLEVNHAKHAKQESGQKIELAKPDQTKQKQLTQLNTNKSLEKLNKNQAPNALPKKEATKNDNIKKLGSQGNKEGKKKGQQIGSQGYSKAEKKQTSRDKELQTLERIKETEKKAKITIQDLVNQYKNAAEDIFNNHGHNPDKERLIEKQLQKWHQDKQQRHEKIRKLQQQALNVSAQKAQRENEKERKRDERKKQKRRQKAQKKLAELRALSEQRLKKEEAYLDYYKNEYKGKQFRFQKLEQEHKERQQQYQEEVKQKLEKNKQKYQPMDREELGDFMDEYEHQRWNNIEENQKKREFAKQLLQKENKELMSKLWKGQCHKRVQEERIQRENLKNQAKTKLEKTKQYGTIVKDGFQPKISEEKRNHSLSISLTTNIYDQEVSEVIDGKSYKKVAREKYSNGVNQGLVIENLRKSLNHEEKNKKGNQYLQFLRSLPKAPQKDLSTVETKVEESPEQGRKKTPSTTFKPRILKNPYYENSSDRVVSKSATMDHKRIKDPELFQYLMADMRSRIKELELEERAIKYGRYNGILELQDRHNNLNRKLVQGISEKLSILGNI